ncbi:MAG: hypothetical protein IT466_02750 [Moraxellaceae bacterium]|jgi:hypothetical protein|nr:hypothetical protein [Moraxellaceae bacterium]
MDALMNDVFKSEHLVWDLGRLSDHDRATRFAMRFQQSLCVYSPPVQQLYTNYEIIVPEDDHRKLIILPNPHAFHDIFNRINEDSIVQTSLFITPDDKGGLQLLIPMSGGRQRAMPLAVGLNFIQNKLGPEVPFLPVLAKGDLREFKASHPMLHLHRIVLSKVDSGISEMEIRAIRKVIQDKLIKHFGFAAIGNISVI